MDDIITSGSATASPRFHAQDDTMDLAGDMDDELDYGEEEDEDEEEPVLEICPRGNNKRLLLYFFVHDNRLLFML